MLNRKIRKTGQNLGYLLDEGGVCNGYTLGWLEAMLAGEDNLK